MSRSHPTAAHLSRVHPSPAAGGTALELPCPDCGEAVRALRADLAEGAVLLCTHCNLEGELVREADGADDRTRWRLVEPLSDYEDDLRS